MAANERAFSLIELISVIAIIMILATLSFSSGSSRQQRQTKECGQNLEKIFLALQIYSNDNGGKFPADPAAQTSEQALAVLVPRYTSDTEPFRCPGAKTSPLRSGASFRDWKISYAYYLGRHAADVNEPLLSDAQVNARSKQRGDDLFSADGMPPGNNHGRRGGNVLFGDGRVELSPPAAAFSLVLTQSVVLLNP